MENYNPQWVENQRKAAAAQSAATQYVGLLQLNVVFQLVKKATNELAQIVCVLPAKLPLHQCLTVIEQQWEQHYYTKHNAQAELQIAVLARADGNTSMNYTFPVGAYFPHGSTMVVMAEASDLEEIEDLEESDKLPVTIITGFLGSGKTTLMNYIMTENHGKKLAVIQNEMGSVEIDGSLVADKMETVEDLQVLENGCICCTVRSDLRKALDNILDRIENLGKRIDGILIETTGIADPMPVIQVFNVPDLKSVMRLDSIITIVDVKRISEQLDRKVEKGINEAIQQVVFADRILLNKTDTVSTDELKQAREKIKTINKFAKMTPCTYAKVDIKKILERQSYSLKQLENEDILKVDEDGDICTKKDCNEKGHGHGHGHGHGKVHSHGHSHNQERGHSSGVGSIGISRKGEIILKKFEDFLRDLLEKKVKDLYRMKGIMAVQGKTKKFVMHGIHESVNFDFLGEWKKDEEKVVKFIVIGKDLDRKDIKKKFLACLVGADAEVTKRKREDEVLSEAKKRKIEVTAN